MSESTSKVVSFEALDQTDQRLSKLYADTVLDQLDIHLSKLVTYVVLDTYTVPTTPAFYPTLEGLAFDVVKSPSFPIGMDTADNGSEVRIAFSAYPIWNWRLKYTYLPDAPMNGTTASDLRALMGFFQLVHATQASFAFRDPDDNAVVGQQLGVGDGFTTTFTLVRTIGLGTNVITEPVGYVDSASSPNIYLNGTLQSTSTWFLINGINTTQRIRFDTAPAAGRIVTADIAYFYKARMAEQKLDFDKFANLFWESSEVNVQSLLSPAGF